MNQPNLSIVIPALNEERSIGAVVAGLRSSLPEAELVVVNADVTRLGHHVARGVISAAVIPHPQYALMQTQQRQINAPAAQPYFILDAYNVAQVNASFPDLFSG